MGQAPDAAGQVQGCGQGRQQQPGNALLPPQHPWQQKRGQHEQAVFQAAGRGRHKHRQGLAPCLRIRVAVPVIVHYQHRGGKTPQGGSRRQHFHIQASRLQVVAAPHGTQAKEHPHEHFSQGRLGNGPGTARIRASRQQGGHPQQQDGPATPDHQVDAQEKGYGKSGQRRLFHPLGINQSQGGSPAGTQPVWRIRTLEIICGIVVQVGAHL